MKLPRTITTPDGSTLGWYREAKAQAERAETLAAMVRRALSLGPRYVARTIDSTEMEVQVASIARDLEDIMNPRNGAPT